MTRIGGAAGSSTDRRTRLSEIETSETAEEADRRHDGQWTAARAGDWPERAVQNVAPTVGQAPERPAAVTSSVI